MTIDEPSGQPEDRPKTTDTKDGGGLIFIGGVFLVAALGFVIYGAMIPNNPPDLIVGTLVAGAGVAGCVLLGFIFIICGLLVGLSKRS